MLTFRFQPEDNCIAPPRVERCIAPRIDKDVQPSIAEEGSRDSFGG